MAVTVGQIYGLWVYDDSMYVRFKVERIEDGVVYAITEDGNDCAVGLSRVKSDGQLIESYRQRGPFERVERRTDVESE